MAGTRFFISATSIFFAGDIFIFAGETSVFAGKIFVLLKWSEIFGEIKGEGWLPELASPPVGAGSHSGILVGRIPIITQATNVKHHHEK